jgi:hypothetical protein
MAMDTDVPRSSGESNPHRFSIDEGNEDYEDLYEKNGLLGLRSSRAKSSKRWIPDSWFNILVSLNAGFSVFLVLGFVLLARHKNTITSSDGPIPPYCKYARTLKVVPTGSILTFTPSSSIA